MRDSLTRAPDVAAVSRHCPPARRPLALLLSTALLLGGCASVDYQTPHPAPALATQFALIAPAGAPAAPQDLGHFWHGFGDPTLDRLVDAALQANGDLQAAQARLREARGNARFAGADRLPAVSAQADGSKTVVPVYDFPGQSRANRTFDEYDAYFIANWELDLFGRASSARDAARDLAEAGEAGLAAARISVVAEVARNYLLLRGTQERLEVTRKALVNQRESLAITEARYNGGRATELDLRRAQALVETTEATLPGLESARDLYILHLATLTGSSPAPLLEALRPPTALPALPATDLGALPVGTPEAWLARRPDLIEAERQFAAATANITVSRAELYPHISLSGLLGFSSSSLSNLADYNNFRYSIGPTVTWNALDFGRVRARIRSSEARADEALANWQQSVRAALEETEGSFTQFSHNQQRTTDLTRAADHSEAAAALARRRYEAGVTDFLTVLDAEREALTTRDQLTQARTDTATALVAVYRTLGGGWEAAAN